MLSEMGGSHKYIECSRAINCNADYYIRRPCREAPEQNQLKLRSSSTYLAAVCSFPHPHCQVPDDDFQIRLFCSDMDFLVPVSYAMVGLVLTVAEK